MKTKKPMKMYKVLSIGVWFSSLILFLGGYLYSMDPALSTESDVIYSYAWGMLIYGVLWFFINYSNKTEDAPKPAWNSNHQQHTYDEDENLENDYYELINNK